MVTNQVTPAIRHDNITIVDVSSGYESLLNSLPSILSDQVAPQRILIKVNLCAASKYSSTSGVWVTPEVADCVLKCLREAWPETDVLLAESDSVGGLSSEEKFKVAGYDRLEEEGLCHLLSLERQPQTQIRVGPTTGKLADICLSTPIISLSKAKTHNIAGFTGTVKNMFGLYAGDKSLLHPYLANAMSEIVKITNPVLGILDANPALQGDGPCRGFPLPLGSVFIANDLLTLDKSVARSLGIHCRIIPDGGNVTELDWSTRPSPGTVAQPTREQSFYIRSGLRVQALAHFIDRLGHGIHDARSWRDISKAARFIKSIRRKS